jgi:hypothetical protein
MSQTATLPVLEDGDMTAGNTAPRRLAMLRTSYPTWIWAGVVLCAIGFALIVYTWGRVAGLLNVALQLPYIVSGGFTGVGLILVGLTVINVATKRQDAAERSRQLSELRELLVDMRSAMEEAP